MNRILLQGDIDVNCYFIEYKGKCFIVDPGYEKNKVIEFINKNNYEVLGILLTHAHVDHIGAIDAFAVPVYLHKNGYELLIDNHKNGFEFYNKKAPYDLNSIDIKLFDDHDYIKLEDKTIEIFYTPGHSIGSVCYKFDDDLYTGDTLFAGSVGRWDFPTGNLEALQHSVISIIDTFLDSTQIHPGHGPSSTISNEKKTNYYYNQWK